MPNHPKSALPEAVLFGRAVTGYLTFSGATEKVSLQGWGLTDPKNSGSATEGWDHNPAECTMSETGKIFTCEILSYRKR